MTPEDNIRWYFYDDLSPKEQVNILAELFITLTDAQKSEFFRMIDK